MKTIKQAEVTTEEVMNDATQLKGDVVEMGQEIEQVVEEQTESKLDKAKGFVKKHKWAIIGAASAAALGVVLLGKKESDVIEGEFEEIPDTFEYDEEYRVEEEVKEHEEA